MRFSTLFFAPFITLLFVFPIYSAVAASGEAQDEPKVYVEIDPKVYPADKFRKLPVEVVVMGGEKVSSSDSFPSAELRNQVFSGIPGLVDEIKELDELDKDLLFMRAKSGSTEKLVDQFPSLTKKVAQRLIDRVSKK